MTEANKKAKTEAKRALLTGITGQDGSYLAELLLEKGYEVHGIIRRSSSFNTGRIDHIYRDRHESGVKLFLHYGDLSDSTNLFHIISEVKPHEIYNLGAMSHVQVMKKYVSSIKYQLSSTNIFFSTRCHLKCLNTQRKLMVLVL